MKLSVCFVFAWLTLPVALFSQQVADSSYRPAIANPAYPAGKGPVVYIDEGHHNFHTRNGRYLPFANLVERDGYRVLGHAGTFRPDRLATGKILVIANALNAVNETNWVLPTPSAFTRKEIEAVKNWVRDGGSLFLIADHMPMAGAAKDLAAEFGFEFSNGFAMDTLSPGPAYFDLKDKTLMESVLTRGRDASESVDRIATFTGQGFRIPEEATPVLKLTRNYVCLMPDTAWAFRPGTPRFNLDGWYQGAFRIYGKGRVVVFGEAAMFTAQLAGPNRNRTGMNSETAPRNYQLLLNIIHWLDGIIPQ
jgi:hypothetical protein